VVLVGKAYWQGLVDWISSTLVEEQKIGREDLKLFHVTDDPAEVLRIIQDARNNGTSNDGESYDR